MAWTDSDLTVIEAAIASGELRVKYQDKEVEYRSLEELLKARDLIREALGTVDRGSVRTYSEFSRGY